VVFDTVTAATNAVKRMNDFPFYDKPMRVAYARTKSDATARAEGTFDPAARDPAVRQKRKAESQALEKQSQVAKRANGDRKEGAVGAEGAVGEATTPPNAILFVQGLPGTRLFFAKSSLPSRALPFFRTASGADFAPFPTSPSDDYLDSTDKTVGRARVTRNPRSEDGATRAGDDSLFFFATRRLTFFSLPGALRERSISETTDLYPNATRASFSFLFRFAEATTASMLSMLFQQFPGFVEVRMVDAKPGIAFVEFDSETRSAVALSGLQGFKINPTHSMTLSYAKK
jgi:RNA recognition motif-containing protein